jgi:CheY-like chemotaxis protein
VSYAKAVPPSADTSGDQTPSARMLPPSETSHRPRVLVLEDNPESRLLLRHLLSKEFEATIVAGADEALRKGAEVSSDVSLLDINLGEARTGVDVLAALRGIAAFGQTPALACTAYALPGDREHFLDAGFADYVSKPFVKSDLLAALRRAIGAPQHA